MTRDMKSQTETVFGAIRHDNKGERYFSPREARRPTKQRPGSRAKIKIMAGRVERGEAIHHPGDASCLLPSHELPGDRCASLRCLTDRCCHRMARREDESDT